MAETKPDSLIYIEWCDAISAPEAWIDKDSAIEWGDNEDWIIKQTGFLLKETEEYVLLAGRINPHSENEEILVNGIVKIPKTWIRKRVSLDPVISSSASQ